MLQLLVATAPTPGGGARIERGRALESLYSLQVAYTGGMRVALWAVGGFLVGFLVFSLLDLFMRFEIVAVLPFLGWFAGAWWARRTGGKAQPSGPLE